jgi:hypothetical protein
VLGTVVVVVLVEVVPIGGGATGTVVGTGGSAVVGGGAVVGGMVDEVVLAGGGAVVVVDVVVVDVVVVDVVVVTGGGVVVDVVVVVVVVVVDVVVVVVDVVVVVVVVDVVVVVVDVVVVVVGVDVVEPEITTELAASHTVDTGALLASPEYWTVQRWTAACRGAKSFEVATPAMFSGLVERKTSTRQAGSLKSRKVMLPVGTSAPTSVPVARTTVPRAPPVDGAARIAGTRLATTIVKVWHAGTPPSCTPHTVVGPKLPAPRGTPVTKPTGESTSPGGSWPLRTQNVVSGACPLAVNWCR